jgi:hypothetical protein
MRTTIDIDQDVLLAAKDLARRQKKTAGAVISELARRALTQPATQSGVKEATAFYGFKPLPRRGGVISNDLINQLREDDVD